MDTQHRCIQSAHLYRCPVFLWTLASNVYLNRPILPSGPNVWRNGMATPHGTFWLTPSAAAEEPAAKMAAMKKVLSPISSAVGDVAGVFWDEQKMLAALKDNRIAT